MSRWGNGALTMELRGRSPYEVRNRLDDVLRRYQALRTVYDCKVELQNLWKRSAQSQEGVLLALQEWCRKAEDTGNCYIQNFARYLQCYRLQTVVPVKS